MASEIARMLQQENREKKKIGSNIHSRTGTRGYIGKMLFPSDIMSRKDKYNYRKNGKVKTYKMNELILTKDQFEQKDEETQRLLMTRWRELYSNKEIMESMGVRGNAAFHNLITSLGVPRKTRIGAGRPPMNKNKTKAAAAAKKEKAVAAQRNALEVQPQQQPQQQAQQVLVMDEPQQVELIKTGLNLEYIGEYNAEQLSKIFTKLQLIIDGEENKFSIKISLRENES